VPRSAGVSALCRAEYRVGAAVPPRWTEALKCSILMYIKILGSAMREAVFRAIADPQRRKLLKLLQQGSMTAGEIAARFEITKGSLSYHFNILKGAGLIRCERRAQEQVYSLNTSVFEEIAAMLLEFFPVPTRPLRRKA